MRKVFDTLKGARLRMFFTLASAIVLYSMGYAHNEDEEHMQEHQEESSADRFHINPIRIWAYRDFVPNGKDSDILGVEVNSAWGWGNFDVANISYIEFADYPRPVPGRPAGNPEGGTEAATGITDLIMAFLFSQKGHHGAHHFAYGLAGQLPTATDKTLGSEKWSVGPAIEYAYENDRFFAAFVALQLWSVAGNRSRKDVSMLMIKPMITYDIAEKWKVTYMPYGISVYWNKPAGEGVYLPLGGGVQHNFLIGQQEIAISAQFFKYVVRSTKGSEYDLRFMLEFDF